MLAAPGGLAARVGPEAPAARPAEPAEPAEPVQARAASEEPELQAAPEELVGLQAPGPEARVARRAAERG